VTVTALGAMKARGERITMLTAYDATFARMLDAADIDVLLVGDSLGMVVQGHDTTLPVTVDEVIYHCRAVARGSSRAHIVGDMPFMSHQISPEDALRNAGRFLSEGGAHAVKLEGGRAAAPTMHAMGGFRVQGKTEAAAELVLDDALAVAQAGAYAVVLEGIPSDLAAQVTRELDVPTIGIGAGPHCDGQVLVCYDLLGLTPDLRPKFVKRYAEMFEEGVGAAARYREEVRTGAFPTEEHAFGEVQREPGVSRSPRGASVLQLRAGGYGPQD
jgi:3-methyl-2-oxobutanoate hydroxymethyltransferase